LIVFTSPMGRSAACPARQQVHDLSGESAAMRSSQRLPRRSPMFSSNSPTSLTEAACGQNCKHHRPTHRNLSESDHHQPAAFWLS